MRTEQFALAAWLLKIGAGCSMFFVVGTLITSFQRKWARLLHQVCLVCVYLWFVLLFWKYLADANQQCMAIIVISGFCVRMLHMIGRQWERMEATVTVRKTTADAVSRIVQKPGPMREKTVFRRPARY